VRNSELSPDLAVWGIGEKLGAFHLQYVLYSIVVSTATVTSAYLPEELSLLRLIECVTLVVQCIRGKCCSLIFAMAVH
jgi:hypothetical protein